MTEGEGGVGGKAPAPWPADGGVSGDPGGGGGGGKAPGPWSAGGGGGDASCSRAGAVLSAGTEFNWASSIKIIFKFVQMRTLYHTPLFHP